MRNVLLRSTSIAVLGFGLAAAPLAFAQDTMQQTTTPSVTAPSPTTGTAPDPSTTVPERMEGSSMNHQGTMGTTATGTSMDGKRVTVVGGTQPVGTVLATHLQGEPVENSAGEDLATLDDFVIDEQGRIVGAVVSFGGFLGMGQKSVLLPWEDLQINGLDGTVTLAMSHEQIEALPEFEAVEREDNTAANAPARTTAPASPNAPVNTQ